MLAPGASITVTTTFSSATLNLPPMCDGASVSPQWTVNVVAAGTSDVPISASVQNDAASVTGLRPGTSYDYQVMACCADICLDQPLTGSFVTLSAADIPTVTVGSVTTSGFTLTFSSQCSGGLMPSYTSIVTGPNGSPIAATSAAAETSTYTGLVDGTGYDYQVTACCHDTDQSSCTSTSGTALTRNIPGAPVTPATVCFGYVKLCLTWLPPLDSTCSDGADLRYEYDIYKGASCSGSPVITNSTSGQISPGQTIPITTLDPNTQYSWRVRSCCGTDGCAQNPTCVPGKTLAVPSGNGTVAGDPHIRLPDGGRVDLKKCGDYVMYRAKDGSHEVQTRMTERGWGFSVTGGVAVRCANTLFTVYLTATGTLQTFVDEGSAAVTVPISTTWTTVKSNLQVTRTGSQTYNIRCTNPNLQGFSVSVTGSRANAWFYLDWVVSMPPKYVDKTEGLLGTYNGDSTDDIKYGTEAPPQYVGQHWTPPASYSQTATLSINVESFPTLQGWHDSWAVYGPLSLFKKNLCKFDSTVSTVTCPADSWSASRRHLLARAPFLDPNTVIPPPDYSKYTAQCLKAIPTLTLDAADQCGYDGWRAAKAASASGNRRALLQLKDQIGQIASNYGKLYAGAADIKSVSIGTVSRRNLLSTDKKNTKLRRTGKQQIQISGSFPSNVANVFVGSLGGHQTPLSIKKATKTEITAVSDRLNACGQQDITVRLADGKVTKAYGALNVLCASVDSVKVKVGKSAVEITVKGSLGGDVSECLFGNSRGSITSQSSAQVVCSFPLSIKNLVRNLQLKSKTLGIVRQPRVRAA